MKGNDSDSSRQGPVPEAVIGRVERSFTCTVCGYGRTHSATRLQTDVHATCVNCGDWTVQTAAIEDVIDAVYDIAGWFDGTILTERQSVAYLLRDIVGVDRQVAAAEMDTTPSNVDNLQRRGREKVADARRIVAGLEALEVESDGG